MPQTRCAPPCHACVVPVSDASNVPTVPAWKQTQMGKHGTASKKNTSGNQPRGPGSSIQRWNGCAPVRTMCRALAKTRIHFSASTSRKSQSGRYPNKAPARAENTSSPTPIVSEAMTAPGPKIASHRRGFRESSEAGGGTHGRKDWAREFTWRSVTGQPDGFEAHYLQPDQ